MISMMLEINNLKLKFIYSLFIYGCVIFVFVESLSSPTRSVLSSQSILESLNHALTVNPCGLRLFQPAYPLSLLTPISREEAGNILRVKELTDSLEENINSLNSAAKYPWNAFPKLGIPDSNLIMSRSEIINSYEKNRHFGQFVWSYLLDKPRKGSLIVNHWKQQVICITEYDTERGAKGFELNQSIFTGNSAAAEVISWPPLALEIEIDQGKWQPVCASENILSGEIIRLLPPELPKATWELVFLLLVSPQRDAEVFQALLDTGLSPRQGLIAYLRLLNKVVERTEANENTPSYRQIVEKEITL